MISKNCYIGKWELGCLVFNSCVYKMFTSYPKRFIQISGSAGWITALFTGIVFLGVLYLLLSLFKPYERTGLVDLAKTKGSKGFATLLFLGFFSYWTFSLIYALKEFSLVLKAVSYVNSPQWYIIFFLLLGGIIPSVYGGRSVYRLHSLSVLSVGITALLIGIFGLRYANPYYLAPILGNGIKEVFLDGLSTIFMYSDIIFVFLLSGFCKPDVKFRKTVMSSGALAVVVNVILLLVFSMSQSTEANSIVSIPIYPLTKSAYFGRFWSRMDLIYLVTLITSGILYISLAIHIILLSAKGFSTKLSSKRTVSVLLCISSLFFLTGCFDSREVEQSGYLLAIGIDKGESSSYRYTFQLSSPLSSGDNSDSNKKSNPMETESEPKNKGVNNTVIEADNFYTALDTLKGSLSKTPELSHLKLIVFSKDMAREGLLEHSSLLFKEREIRPGATLCLADSARDYLLEVKPTLEESTARYYELLFNEDNSPYAPTTQLWEFVSKSMSSSEDCVLPIAENNALEGMGIFKDGVMIDEVTGDVAGVYKLLKGNAKKITKRAGHSLFSLSSYQPPKISVKKDTVPIEITIDANLDITLIQGDFADVNLLQQSLSKDMTDFLTTYAQKSCDPLGVGNSLRIKCLTDHQWKTESWREKITTSSFYVNLNTKIEESAYKLQNY